MKSTHKAIRSAAVAPAILLTALLAACGGGGGGSSTPTSTSGAGTSTSSSGTDTLTTPQYAAGSAQLAAFNQLNQERQACGFPTVSENTLLDQAATDHMTYMQDNAIIGHSEVTGPGYTGATPQARAVYVGYVTPGAGGYAGELIAPFTADVGGALSVVALSSVPYHEAGLFIPTRDFGMTYNTVRLGPSATDYVAEITTGDQGTAPALTSDPLTYPCQGTTNVDYESAQVESPAPLGIDTGTNPVGTPIAVVGDMGDTVVLSSGQLTGPGGSVITLDLLDSANDSNGEMPANAAAAFSASPLQPNTSYGATITGTVNGVAFSRNFTFTTGNQGQF